MSMRSCALSAVLLIVWHSDATWAAASTPGSQTPPPGKAASVPPSVTLAAPAPPQSLSEKPTAASDTDRQIALLKAQIEITRGFQSDVLSTVYWALAFLGTLTVVLIGYNWYTNSRMYERDRDALIDDLTSSMTNQITDAAQTLRAEALAERERVESALLSLRAQMLGRIEETVNLEREKSAAALTELTKGVEAMIQASRKTVESRVNFLRLELNSLELKVAKSDSNWGLVVTIAFYLIEYANEIANDFFARSGLEELGAALDNGGRVSKTELEKAPRLLNGVPVSLAELAGTVLTKVGNAKVVGS